MPKGQATNANLEAAFTRLSAQLKNRQHKKALKSIDDILKVEPRDEDALKCKAIVLVESSKFAEAIELLSSPKLREQFAFEHAYCLYRTGRFQEALSVCETVDNSRAVPKLHLQAQLHYRLGQTSDAIHLYKQLLQQHKVTSLELSTNVVAAHIAAGRSKEVPDVLSAMQIGPHEGFEVAFNLGCAQLACHDFEAAHDQLLHAQRLGQEAMLDEDLEGDALEAELAPVSLQLAFAASKLGRHPEAAATYQALSRLKLDEESGAVLQANTITENMLSASDLATKKFFLDSLRHIEPLIHNGPELQVAQALQTRLAVGQQQALFVNYALLLVLAGRTDASRSIVTALAERWPQAQNVALLQAAWAAHTGDDALADAALVRASQHTSDASQKSWSSLTRAQLAASRGQLDQAFSAVTQASQDISDAPAVVATLTALAEATGDVQGALRIVRGALQAHGVAVTGAKVKVARGKEAAVHWLLQRLAGLQLQDGDVSGALGTFGQLKGAGGGVGPGALRVLGQLAKAGLSGDTHNRKGLKDLEAQLPPIQPISQEESDRLENTVPGAGAIRRKRPDGTRQRTDDAPKKRHKKKPRLPKDFDPANPGPPPDPERWLPKWQRSDFKRRRGQRRRDKDAVKGSQGAGKVDEALDRTKIMDIDDPGEGTSSGPARPPPSNRKKKGRR